MMYFEYVFQKHQEKKSFSENVGKIPYIPSLNDDILSLVFAPDPVSRVPVSDLVLMNQNNLAPELFDYISKLTQQHVTSVNPPLSSDKKVFESIIPYFIDNETQIIDFYKARGYDVEKIENLLLGNDIGSDSDGSSAESDTNSE